MRTLYHECYFGLGDNIYERSFVIEMAKDYDQVYIRTPFPQLYWDQDLTKYKFLPRHSRLHTQTKNINSFTAWANEPATGIDKFSSFWNHQNCFAIKNIFSRFAAIVRSTGSVFNFKMPFDPIQTAKAQIFLANLHTHDKRICIIKRPTLRKEWYCPARNPKIEYFQRAIDRLKRDYFFVSVADLRAGEEWLDGNLSGIDLELHRGEIDIWTLMAMVKLADLSICTQSFFVPVALLTSSKCFCIYGGFGSPARYIYPPHYSPNFGFAQPVPNCDCLIMDHDCFKEIPNFDAVFESYLKKIGVIK